MEQGYCRQCGNEAYIDDSGICTECQQKQGGGIQIGACRNCGTETYINDQNLCENCYQELNPEGQEYE